MMVKRASVSPKLQVTNDTGAPGFPVHLLIALGGPDRSGTDAERMVEDIALRATQVGPVLEKLFLETEKQPVRGWGLND